MIQGVRGSRSARARSHSGPPLAGLGRWCHPVSPHNSGVVPSRPSSSCTSSWRCPRRHHVRFMVQFLSLCGQDLVLAGCRRRLHEALEPSIVLTNFFVRTAILPNRLRCTAIWLPSKQTKKRGADEADLEARLRLQEDPTPTSTSPRSATSAPTTGTMEAATV